MVDVGGGSSALARRLLDLGFTDISVVDVSRSALARARELLGGRAAAVRWIEADVTSAPPLDQADVWHDRAVFHFFVDADDRRAYVNLAARTVREGGHAVVATFGPSGPTRCSGLPVVRYDAESLEDAFSPAFELLDSAAHEHRTPAGTTRQFTYALLQRRP